jgi:hypothetical protein
MQSSGPEQTKRIVVIVWAALFASVGLHFMLTRVLPPPAPVPDSQLPAPFLALAIAAALGSFYFKARFGVRGDQPRPLAMVRAAYIMALVFSEIPSLLGLVLFFMVNWPRTWVFFVISALAFAINFPSSEDFDSLKN